MIIIFIQEQDISAGHRWTACIDNNHHFMSVNHSRETGNLWRSWAECYNLPLAMKISALGHRTICPPEDCQSRKWMWGKISPICGQLPNLPHVVSSQCTTWTFETCQVSARATRFDKIVAAVIDQHNIYQRAVDLLTFRWWTWTKSTSILEYLFLAENTAFCNLLWSAMQRFLCCFIKQNKRTKLQFFAFALKPTW